MRVAFILGVALLVISAPTLYLMSRERAIRSAVHTQYTVERIVPSKDPGMYDSALSAELAGHTVQLVDDQPVKPHEPFKLDDARVPGSVQVLVDGRVYSTPVAATIRLNFTDANRYWGFVYLMKLVDTKGPERLVVAEHLGGEEYRTISVFPDGHVVQDQFSYEGRCSPPVRADLIRSVVPHPSGYCSDVLTYWPSLYYPILFPWISGALGAILISGVGLIWSFRLWRRRAGAGPPHFAR
jgi:hypothetical protein